MRVQVFSDRDITTQRAKIEGALAEADVFFGSLLFDYDQVSILTCYTYVLKWLQVRLQLRVCCVL